MPGRGLPGVRPCTGCEESQGAPSQPRDMPCVLGRDPRAQVQLPAGGAARTEVKGRQPTGHTGATITREARLEGVPRPGTSSPPGLPPCHLQPPTSQIHLGVLRPTSERAHSIQCGCVSFPDLGTRAKPPATAILQPRSPPGSSRRVVFCASQKGGPSPSRCTHELLGLVSPASPSLLGTGQPVPMASQPEGGGVQPTALGRPCPGHQGHFSGLQLWPRPPSPSPELPDMNLGLPRVTGPRSRHAHRDLAVS